jgi:NAD+--asparagine ADP-ribosyltransferase
MSWKVIPVIAGACSVPVDVVILVEVGVVPEFHFHCALTVAEIPDEPEEPPKPASPF